MSVIDAVEKLKPSLRHTRYAINGRGGEISDTAGMKDLRDAIFNIPADNAITTVTVEAVDLGGFEIPENTTGYAYIAEFGGICRRYDNSIFQEALNSITSYGAGYDWDTVDSIDGFTVPNEIKALDGYGLGISLEYYNKVDLVNKKYHYCVKEVEFDGSEDWARFGSGANLFYAFDLSQNAHYQDAALCNLYDFAQVGSATTEQGWFISSGVPNRFRVRPDLSLYPDVASWKAHLAELSANRNPLTLIYALAEPIVTDLPVYVNPLIKVESGSYGLELFPSDGQGMPYKIIMQTYTQ